MPIVIETEKVWDRNKPARKILRFDCLKYTDLPEEYRRAKSGPRCFVVGDSLVIWEKWIKQFGCQWAVGDVVPEGQFKKAIKVLNQAGDRLMRINRKLKWSGTETFTI